MPWHIIQKGSQYCVAKSGESNPIKGGCHPTKKEAVAHMGALYVNVAPEGKKYRRKG